MILRTLMTALLAVLMAPTALAQSYDHVVVVFDASGSMNSTFPNGQSKMSAAKAALKQVVSQTPPDTRIGLLVFGGDSGWRYELAVRDEAKLNAAIDGIEPNGGTPLGQNLKVGADALLREREKQHGYGTYQMLVVTDGKAGDQALVSKYTPLLLERGLVLDVIGVQMKDDHMLKGVAHSYRSADDPDSLIEAVRQVFAEVSISGDGEVASDAFEVLEGLPDSFALATIEALASSPALNHPLDSKPKPKPVKDALKGATTKVSKTTSTGERSSGCSHAPLSGSMWFLALALIRRRSR